MIGVLDLGIGNVRSLQKAINVLNFEYKIISTKKEFHGVDKIILPGVGSYLKASQKISDLGLRDTLRIKMLEDQIPFLGICLGMQLLSTTGTEGGVESRGLDMIPGVTAKIQRPNKVKLPHMGWNGVKQNGSCLYNGIDDNSCFYFVHGYEYKPSDENVISASVDYYGKIVASIQRRNIFGTQFHPEKSQVVGLKLLQNFLEFK
jgi:glutamine amidotransferase